MAKVSKSLHRCLSVFFALICIAGTAPAADDTWQNVERIVAIGDVHGDYEAFEQLLRETGVINKRGRWTGGKTHLVQIGDVPDRGPDSRKIMDLLMNLEKQARRARGRVHALIGNHEAMNMYGDLRYVDAGEYQAFVDRRSKSRQQNYYDNTISYLQQTLPPEDLPVFDEAYRESWLKRFPLGYVEHRLAWAPDGKYGKWVRSHNTVIKINDTLFVHGGIGPKYGNWSFAQVNDTIASELAGGETTAENLVIEDQDGPLWYRGLSQGLQSCELSSFLDVFLAKHGASRVVVAHTPTAGVILPRYDGRIIAADTGMSAYYGGTRAALIIEGEKLSVMHEGELLSPIMPVDPYLERVQAVTKDAPLFARYMAIRARRLAAPPVSCDQVDGETPSQQTDTPPNGNDQ